MDLENLIQETGYVLQPEQAGRHNRYRFTLMREGRKKGDGTHFTGSGTVRPWIEVHLEDEVNPESRRHRHLFNAFAEALEPGSHMMVHYLGTETADALTADVPPPATPLGFLMWEAGFRWFKDWYFTEGWMEGSQKLQGNLPLDSEIRREREAEMQARLEGFLDSETEFEQCKKLAHEVLDGL